MRIVRIVFAVLMVVALVAIGAYFYLTAREAVPETSSYALDLSEIRRLADSLPGPKPLRVNSELVAEAALPKGAIFAGESLRTDHRMVHPVFQIAYADRFLLLDSGFDPEMHQAMAEGSGLPFHDDAWQRVQDAFPRAEAIVLTHEHADHMKGLAVYPDPEALVGRVRFNEAQLANTERMDAVEMPQVLRETEPLAYDPYLALAPGVVLIRAAGHTPGSQLAYVALADGRELLFIGDVAWHMDAIRNLHYRPRIVTNHFLNEDRAAVLAQFRRLHALDRDHPEVTIVVSHDPQRYEAFIGQGLIGARFE